MRTQAQIAASGANGAKSRPVSATRKSRSSRNATRHGFLAGTVVLKGESEERFLEHMRYFTAELRPEGVIERELVEKMAVCRWRQLSIRGLETAVISVPRHPP